MCGGGGMEGRGETNGRVGGGGRLTNSFSVPIQKGNNCINEIIRLSVNDKTNSIIYTYRR